MSARSILYRFLYGGRRYVSGLDRWLEAVVGRLNPVTDFKTHREAIHYLMANYDMASVPDESFCKDQYLHWIREFCHDALPENPAVLDVCCGQGRLSLAVAGWLEKLTLTGVDYSPEAVARARHHAEKAGLNHLRFVLGDALDHLRDIPSATLDLVLFIDSACWSLLWSGRASRPCT